MRSLKLLVGLLVLTGGLAACQGRVAPLSAQAGSTILIPLKGASPISDSNVGYGGREVSDPQRGELVYRLGAPNGFPLVTLASTRVVVDRKLEGMGQLVSLVEIPIDAPLGSHDIFVAHRRFDPATGNVVEQAGPDYNGQLQILPQTISVDLPGGGSELIEGRPTPLEIFGLDWVPISVVLPVTGIGTAVPDPHLRVTLLPVNAIRAASVTLEVPDAVAEVLDVRVHSHAAAWLQDVGVSGGLHTYIGTAVATADTALGEVTFPFKLVNSSVALLDPASVTVFVTAWDKDGSPIPAQVSSVVVF